MPEGMTPLYAQISNYGYYPMFGANGVNGYLAPQAQVNALNAANAALPAYARYNPTAIENAARTQQAQFMRDYASPYLARVGAQNSIRAGEGMNSFAQQDNAFENAEMARQASNVYMDAKSNELAKLAALRSSYMGVPTNDMGQMGEAGYQASIQQAELERQRKQDMWGRVGMGVQGGAPFFGAGLQAFGNAYSTQANNNPNAGVVPNVWNALFGGQ